MLVLPWWAARVFPADPIGTIGTVFAFPDGDPLFEAVDHEPARAESFAPMRRAGGADHGHLANLERSRAVQSRDAYAGDLGFDFRANAIHLRTCHARVSFVIEAGDGAAVVHVAHGAEKDGNAARAFASHERD